MKPKHIQRVWEANANDLLRAYNCHDELIAALKNILLAYHNVDSFRDELILARVVLAKAEGGNHE